MAFSEKEMKILRELEESFNAGTTFSKISSRVVGLKSTSITNRRIWQILSVVSLIFIIVTFTMNTFVALIGCAGLFFSVYKIYSGWLGYWAAIRRSEIEERRSRTSSQ